MTELQSDQIDAAVEWWCAALASAPYHRTLRDEERARADSQPAAFAEVLGEFVASQHKPTDEQIERFRRSLTDTLRSARMQHLESGALRGWQVVLGVDYGPGRLLADSADSAGIHRSRFPIKTTMFLDENGSVRVSKGYGAPYETIKHATEAD